MKKSCKACFLSKGRSGVSLGELLIALGILGLVSTLSLSKLLFGYQDAQLAALRQSTLGDTANIQELAKTTIGTFPMSFGPAKIFQRFSAMKPVSLPQETQSVGVCPTGGENTFSLPSGAVLTNVSDKWLASVELSASLPNGRLIPANVPGDAICVALRGEQSKTLNKDAFWLFIEKDGSPQLATLPLKTDVNLFSAYYTYAQSLNQIALNNTNNFFANGHWEFHYADMGLLAMRQFFGESEETLNLVRQRIDGFLNTTQYNHASAAYGRYVIDNFLTKTVSEGGIMSENFKMNQAMDIEATQFSIFDQAGNRLAQVDVTQFLDNLTIQGVTWADLRQQYIDANGLPNMSIYRGNGKSNALNAEWKILFDVMEPFTTSDINNLGSLKEKNILYHDPNSNVVYQVNGSFFSPLKVSLQAVDAALDSHNGFLFDVDGFNAHQTEAILTTGGLASNEAWLATDRDNNGFMDANGMLDGADVFGDHQGQYSDGYRDLAALYSAYLKTDAQGLRYLELKPLSAAEKAALLAQRQSGQRHGFIPSLDLKLVLADGSVQDAAHVFDRIYVDSQQVSEQDKTHRNQITERAMVRYRNGQVATSADQWFQTEALAKDVLSGNTKLAHR